ALMDILRGLDGKAAMRMNGSFGTSRGAGSVNQHQGILCAGGLRGGDYGLAGNEVMPPVVSGGIPIDFSACTALHDDMLDGVDLNGNFVRRAFQRNGFSSPMESIRRKEGFGR